jgi:hypothetical protein
MADMKTKLAVKAQLHAAMNDLTKLTQGELAKRHQRAWKRFREFDAELDRRNLLDHYELRRDGNLPETQKYRGECSLRSSVTVTVEATDAADAYDLLTEWMRVICPYAEVELTTDWEVHNLELITDEEEGA